MSFTSIISNYIKLVVSKDIIKIYLKDLDFRFKASGEVNPAKIISNLKLRNALTNKMK